VIPGAAHSVSQNASVNEPAVMLVVIIGDARENPLTILEWRIKCHHGQTYQTRSLRRRITAPFEELIRTRSS
jgi:hypothetical protein